MYNLGPEFQNVTTEPGTNLLVSGPPLSGVRRLAFEALAHGISNGEAVLVMTTRYSAQQVLADLNALADTDSATVGVVDCVTRRQNRAHTDDRRVKYVTSPAALTRIGIKFSEFIKEFRAMDIDRTRVVFDSLSAMLPYADTQSAFKFIHVLAGQIDDANALGIHVIQPGAHDEETRRTIAELFDAHVSVENNAVADIDI